MKLLTVSFPYFQSVNDEIIMTKMIFSFESDEKRFRCAECVNFDICLKCLKVTEENWSSNQNLSSPLHPHFIYIEIFRGELNLEIVCL